MSILTSIPNGASMKDVRDTVNAMLADIALLKQGGGTPTPTPAMLSAATVPTLRAAYLAGGRGVLSILGDSTTLAWGAGSGGPNNTQNGCMALGPAAQLRALLNNAGIKAVDGCVAFGNRVSVTDQTQSLIVAGLAHANPFTTTAGAAGPFVLGDAQAGFSWTELTPWGPFAFDDQSQNASLQWTPGITYDRVEYWIGNPNFGYTVEVSAGGSVIDTLTESTTPYNCVRRSITAPRGTGELKFRDTTTNSRIGLGAARVWDSTIGAQVQVETLGNAGWKTSDWCTTGQRYSPLTAIPLLGSHAFIINLGLNDANAGRSAAAFKADLKTIASACKAAGADVLLAVPTQASGSFAVPAAYITAISEVAGELSLPTPINLQAISLVAGDFADQVHLKGSGYAKVGQAYFDKIAA